MSIVTLTMNPAVDASTTVARVIPKLKLRCAEMRRDPGGGGINVARVVARMGGPVCAIFPAGGHNGDILRRLVEMDVTSCEIVPISGETRENVNVREDATGDQYRFIFPGPRLRAGERDACLRSVASLRPVPKFFVISGGLPVGVEADFIASVIKEAKRLGCRVVADASGPALAAALDEGVFLVKPNLRELEDLVGSSLGGRAAALSACRTLIKAKKANVVALTLGAEGAILVTQDVVREAPALQVDKKSEIGAGDSFVGAFVWALDSGRDLEEAFRFGMAAGAAALIAPGTQLSRRDDVVRLVKDVSVSIVTLPQAG